MTNVLLLFGGPSNEHEISQLSASNIYRGLKDAGFEVFPVGISKNGDFLPFILDPSEIKSEDWEKKLREALKKETGRTAEISECLSSPADGLNMKKFFSALCPKKIDLIFPAVHGINCEDGLLQGMLEWSGYPYVGSGVLASSMSMDKNISKIIAESMGVKTVPSIVVPGSALKSGCDEYIERIISELGFPCFIKPVNGGSSVGTAKCEAKSELKKLLLKASEYDSKVLVEKFISAREIELAVLGNDDVTAAFPGEIAINAAEDYYDYDTKYLKQGSSELKIPADLNAEETEYIRDAGVRIYKGLGIRGLARVDFFKDRESSEIYFNEVNNLPGFTAISLFPKAFEQMGYTLAGLLKRLCELALEDAEHKKRRTDR